MIGWAFLIGRVPPLYITLLALTALLFNMFLLPRLTGRGLEREKDLELGFSPGMIAYPAMVLLISLLFFHQQIYLAIAWGAMAFGDGFAGVIGARYGRHTLSPYTKKTWEGSIAFILFGFAGTMFLVWFLPAHARLGLPWTYWWKAVLFSAVVAAAAESLRGNVNDNIIVPLAAAFGSYFFIHALLSARLSIPECWWTGLLCVTVLAAVSYLSGRFDLRGSLTGGGVTALVFAGAGIHGLLLLFLFVAGGVAGSAWKYREKVSMGLAQENRNRRTPIHVLANGGVPAVCALLAWLFPDHAALFTGMMAAALASALADTWSSELGNLYGSRFVNLVSFRPDVRGLDGVVSAEGTLAGVAGALLMALLYGAWINSMQGFFLVFSGGVAGTLIDSLLGATLQRKGFLTNHSVNLINTLFAALLYFLVYTMK